MDVNEREQAAVAARLLMLARPLTRLCRVFTLLLLLLMLVWLIAWLIAGLTGARMAGPLAPGAGWIATMTAAVWAYSEWVSARLHLDKSIFEDVASEKLTFARLDAVLGRSDRPFAERWAGARGLLRRLGITAIVLFCLFVTALAT